jgi:hypothetical protein
MDVTISIITADDGDLIRDCLHSLYETTREVSFETYVIINNPEKAQRIERAIKEAFPEVNIIANQEERGFTYNHNMAIRRSACKYVLILNDDTVLLEGAIDRMHVYMETHPEVGILGCKILNPDGSLQWSCGKSAHHAVEHLRSGVLRTVLGPLIGDQFFDSTQEVTWVTGACLMARSAAIRDVGPLDENIAMYFDDGDWCYRMILSGWKVVYYIGAAIIHYRSQTSQKHLAKTTLFYYQSRLYFFSKHYGPFTLHTVRMLTMLDAAVRYLRTLLFLSSTQKQELLGAFTEVMRLTWSFKKGAVGHR